MVGIDDFFKALKLLQDTISKRKKKESDTARAFFEIVVDPSFKNIQQIHDNYTESISKLAKYLQERKLPPEELIDWLRNEGLKYRSMRESLWTIEEELRGQSYSDLSALSDRGDIQAMMRQYVTALLKYFHVTTGHNDLSFYRSYEQHLRAHLAMINKNSEINTVTKLFYSGDFVIDMHDELIKLVDKALPNSWKSVVSEYRLLRSGIGIDL